MERQPSVFRSATNPIPPPVGGVALPPKQIPAASVSASAGDEATSGEPKRRWKGDFEPIRERTPRPQAISQSCTDGTGDPSLTDAEAAAAQDPRDRKKRPLRFANGIPAWLISLIIHTLLLVALVLIQVRAGLSSGGFLLVSLSDSPREAVTLMQLPSEPLAADISGVAAEERVRDQSTAVSAQSSSTEINIRSPLKILESSANDYSFALSDLTSSRGDQIGLQQLPVGGLYRRDAESRAKLGAEFGATPESEDAVEAALKWLAAHQKPDGSWSFDLSQQPCGGRCTHSQQSFAESARPATAATGLALLAFLGAGYSHHEGLYADNVRRGLYFLREASRETQFGLDLQSGSMYGHGIAMLAISEAMAMTRYQGKTDSDLFTLTNRGATFTMVAQHQNGGWRYVPGSPGDMTVTAWQVLSLISAQRGGVILGSNILSRSEAFVRSLSKPNVYEFGYQSTNSEPTTTAIGLCTLLYLGQSPRETLFGNSLDRMMKRGPRLTDVYHDYYATLALHHARHRDWASWHVPLREHLSKTQTTQGHEAGSWHFPDRHGDVGGRLYTTAMAAMILEVYYRYLPLYQPRDEFKLD